MATASLLPTEANDFECSVCHEAFKEPKVLLCGHLICKRCLLSWLKTQEEAGCPLCRDTIVTPKQQDSGSLEEIVDDFPTDLSVEVRLEAERLCNKPHNCCVCDNVVATSMCLNCKDMLCQACTRAHGKLSMSKHHTVEDLSTLTPEKLAAKLSACATHPQESSQLFCPTHGETICWMCAASKHRSCPEVKELKDQMKDTFESMESMITYLHDGEEELEKAIKKLDQHLQDIEERARAASAEIKEMSDRLVAKIKENERRLDNEVEKALRKKREDVMENKTCLSTRHTRLKKHRCRLEHAQSVDNDDVSASMSVKMKTQVYGLDRRVTSPEDTQILSILMFTVDRAVVSDIEQRLAQLGEVRLQGEFYFHDNHGHKVSLSHNHQTATGRGYSHNIVLSRDPLQLNMLYEVRIDVCPPKDWCLCVGVVTETEASRQLPVHAWQLQQAVVVAPYEIKDHGHWRNTKYGAALESLPAGSHVGVSLHRDHSLHVYVNGQDQGVAASKVTGTYHAVFDLRTFNKTQITAARVTKLAG